MIHKNLFIAVMIFAIAWFGFILYMSSQTAVASGQMSNSITKEVISAGEKLGVVAAGTANSEKAIKRYDAIIRNTAHVGMYFVLACVIFSVFWLLGVNNKKSVILCFTISVFISIIDEINQMHFVGRNSGGVIRDGIKDLYRDAFGVCIALTIIVLVRVLTEVRK